MTPTLIALVAVLVVWMSACAWCGFRARAVVFFAVLLVGLGLNTGWMVFGLEARPFEPYAVVAQVSLVLYGVGAFGLGWLIGRIAQRWCDSRVNAREV